MEWSRDKKKISELYTMYKSGDLQLQPFFQRNLVWTPKAKSQFIESILLNLPISEVYLHEDETGRYSVIDGQQRLSTIFHFLDKQFELNGLEKLTELNGQDSSFDRHQQFNNFEIYYVKIDKNVQKDEIIDTYSRINRYTVNLNAQELRRATYNDSDFLRLSEELAQLEFFQYGRFFTERKRARMNDVEFISELLACQLKGIQDKKNKLDEFYLDYSTLENYEEQKRKFESIINEIQSIFDFNEYFNDKTKGYDGTNSAKNLGLTRYRQQADFYSLFYLMLKISNEGLALTLEQKEQFLKILLVYNHYYLITPESDIDILSEYAVKCISQGNTKNSRKFRYEFLRQSLDYILNHEENKLVKEMKEDFKEVFNFSFDPLNINLHAFNIFIDDFYKEPEEND